MKQKFYVCIDLKSFYASVECVLRGLDPLTTNLVVADGARTEKTICLAVTPSLKKYKIPGRARLFEVLQKVDEINRERKKNAPCKRFTGESYNINELKEYPNLALSFIMAPPQMAKYMEYSTKVYNVYLKYIDASDIFVYSIDEVFIDVTNYLEANKCDASTLASKIIIDIFKETGITATGGVGTNPYLAKVAMDIIAKKVNKNEYGVRISNIDEKSYRKLLWGHRPITDFWRIGHGIKVRLEKYGLYTMGDIARLSLSKDEYYNEDILYKEFGINAELIIDHAWGYESATMEDIKSYKAISSSISTGQVLHCAYTNEKTKLIIKEMVDTLSLDLVSKNVLTNQLVLSIGYDIDNLKDTSINKDLDIVSDHYGRRVPKGVHSSINLKEYTSSCILMTEAILKLFTQITNPKLLIRRLSICANHIIDEKNKPLESKYKDMDLFTDVDEYINEVAKEEKTLEKEKNIQKTVLKIKEKYGKNAAIKGMNLEDGATTIDRNKQIGGHKA